MCSMNGSASAPSSATMNGTRCAIRPEMNATSRDRRHSLATTTAALPLRACASAAASFGRRSRASAPLPVSTSTYSPVTSQPSAAAKRAMASRWASIPRPLLDDADVGFLLEQMGGEAVPQGMHAHALVDPGPLRGDMHGVVKPPHGEGRAGTPDTARDMEHWRTL